MRMADPYHVGHSKYVDRARCLPRNYCGASLFKNMKQREPDVAKPGPILP